MPRNVHGKTFGALSDDNASQLAKALLRRAPGFAECPSSVLQQMLDLGRPRTYAMGEHCLHYGVAETHLGLVLQGKLDACVIGVDGRRQLHGLLIPGDLYGLMCLVDQQKSTLALTARQPAQIYLFPYPELKRLRLRQLELVLAFERQVVHRSRQLFRRMEIDDALPPEQRLALSLIMLIDLHGGQGWPGGETRLDYSQVDLADLLSLSRQRVNNVLRQFEGRGLIRQGYACLTVLDRSGLEKLTQEISPGTDQPI